MGVKILCLRTPCVLCGYFFKFNLCNLRNLWLLILVFFESFVTSLRPLWLSFCKLSLLNE